MPRVGIFEIGPLRAELRDVEHDLVFGLANLGQAHTLLYLIRETVCSVLFTEYIQPIAPALASPRPQHHGCKVYWSASL